MKLLVVQKFGGSSLNTLPHIEAVADRIVSRWEEGYQVVVVVSAMGHTTDGLVSQAALLDGGASPENLDFLLMTGEMQSAAFMAMALGRRGIPARALTGSQAGVVTDGAHGRARIREVQPDRVSRLLAQNILPVVTGFQGATPDGWPTTLGRGGSDLTAIAMAAALKADACEIYSDVAGVFTADPHIVPDARALPTLSYDDMLQMASEGAQVLQTQAVRYAREFQVVINARSTFDTKPGTFINQTTEGAVGPVTAVVLDPHVTKISLVGIAEYPGLATDIDRQLDQAGIPVDWCCQARSPEIDVLTVSDADQARAVDVCRRALRDVNGPRWVVDGTVAKISVIGAGVGNQWAIAETLIQSLADARIDAQITRRAESSISCVVARSEAEQGVREVHQAFNLSKSPTSRMELRQPART